MKVYVSITKEVLYNILIEYDISTELIRVVKMCLNETCSKHFLSIFFITVAFHFHFRLCD
jgi:hypothetical protein